MKNTTSAFHFTIFLMLISILTVVTNNAIAQDKNPYVRIATIVVDSAQLDNYKAALKEHAKAAVSLEPGVLTLYAVYDKENPENIMVFEIYASKPAYQFHIQTPHFLKYKSAVAGMVKSLELTDVVPIALETKPG